MSRDSDGIALGSGSSMPRVLAVLCRIGCMVGVWLMGLAGAAHACLICFPYPERTAADVLLESATVVLAREHPDKPFSYLPEEVLKGNADGVEVDLFLDSSTRPSPCPSSFLAPRSSVRVVATRASLSGIRE